VTRLLLILCLFALPATAAPHVSLVDGTSHPGAILLRIEGDVAIFRKGSEKLRLPLRSLVAATLAAKPQTPSPDPFNLYRAGGDRLRGKVAGSGTEVTFSSKAISGLKLTLPEVEAICLGTFFGQVQANYRQLFETQRTAGRDSVVVNRGAKPFAFNGVITDIRKDALIVRMGDQTRELPRDKVYGFVRRGGERAATAEGAVLVRIILADGGRITLPLESVDDKAIRAGGAVIRRDTVMRLEFTGGHVAHLSTMDPISVDEIALFGKAPRWRRDEMVLGGALRLGGVNYGRGIGVQAKSRLEFALGGRWNRFFVICGIDDAASREGQAIFRVIGDGKVLKEVTRRRGDSPATLQIDVTGIDRLVLEALPGDSYTSDLCDWAEARVYNE
jgi:hypothetical protein